MLSLGLVAALPAQAQSGPEKRIAFVVGNAAYTAGALATPANDAGLIAQTLQAAGFDVVGARDLDQNGLTGAMRDFLAKVGTAGPDATVFVYLSGYGLQYQGDNYFLPVDASIASPTDLPIQALRVSDVTRSLAAMQNHGSIVVLDAARAYPFPQSGAPQLAGGLAMVEPDANQLIAFNAAPGTVAPDEAGPYGSYAHALAEMIRVGGLPLGDVFDRTRLRVSDLTKGAEIAWDASKFTAPFTFFDRAADAPAPAVAYDSAAIRSKPIRAFDEKDAYFAALDRDTLAGYEDFLAAYPNDAMARRVRAIVAARREAITWRETWRADTPEAYWSYLRRYPHGPHVWDARRRLGHFEAALEPPPSFTVITYDVPPPPPPEVVYVERPVVYFGDPDFGYAPPPPVVFLAPPPPEFVALPPPPPPVALYVLPEPVFVPVPQWVEPPRNVAPPENNVIFNDIHKTIINNVTVENTTNNEPQPTSPAPGQMTGQAPGQAPGQTSNLTTGQKLAGAAVIGAAGAAALHVALPPSVQKKVLQNSGQGAGQNSGSAAAPAPAASGAVATSVKPVTGNATAHTLTGTDGQPLPTTGKLPNASQGKEAPQAAPGAITSKAAATPTESAAKTDAHTLPGANGQPLPPVGKLPLTPQGKEASQPAPGAIVPKTTAAPAEPTTKADAQAQPGTNGQPLPSVGKLPLTIQGKDAPQPAPGAIAPKSATGSPAKQTAKPSVPLLPTQDAKPLPTLGAAANAETKRSSKPSPGQMSANGKPQRQDGIKTPANADKATAKPQIIQMKHPEAINQPRPNLAAKAPTPKVQLQPKPQQQMKAQMKPQPQVKAEVKPAQQVKAPPANKPAKPQDNKPQDKKKIPCGAAGQPACH